MSPNAKAPSTDRQQTDESLRLEREITDRALGDEQEGIDQLADAVITRARLRADQVLAAARAKMDRSSRTTATVSRVSQAFEKERALEDRVLREERADADEVLRVERAEHVALLSMEREETDKDLLSERVRADDALATRDEFLGIVSHDLRNMLSSIVSSAGLIEELMREHDAEDVLRHAQRIQRGSARMSRLVGDLIDVASIEAGALAVTREIAEAEHVVAEAVETFRAQATANQITLRSEVVSPSTAIAFDPARILQVLVNLLSNAMKFTPAGGRVTVRAQPTGADLCICVTDTGPGIPADKLETVFERFRQLTANDRRGLGLGLYISRCIVQGHGGRVWAESKLGVGSKFCFTLPLAPIAASESIPGVS